MWGGFKTQPGGHRTPTLHDRYSCFTPPSCPFPVWEKPKARVLLRLQTGAQIFLVGVGYGTKEQVSKASLTLMPITPSLGDITVSPESGSVLENERWEEAAKSD